MTQKYFCFAMQILLFSVMCAIFVNAQELSNSLSEILRPVQENVEALKELNINLIAEEEITIEEFDNKGKKRKQHP